MSVCPNTYDPLRRQVVDTILRVGGSAGARTLLAVAPDKPDAVAAVQALGADPEVADDELRELLYAPHADLRMAAFDALVARLERHHLEDLLARYPNERRAYYYNVIAELDRLLYLDAAVGVPADATA